MPADEGLQSCRDVDGATTSNEASQSGSMKPLSQTVLLTQDLVNRESVTPRDSGCQTLIAERLENIGCTVERLIYEDTENLFARLGEHGPLLVFLGHTDVVPSGPLDAWHSPPFQATIRDGYLYGRGAADMKSSVAAMVTALERIAAKGRAGRTEQADRAEQADSAALPDSAGSANSTNSANSANSTDSTDSTNLSESATQTIGQEDYGISQNSNPTSGQFLRGSVAILLTSDEEGSGKNGIVRVMQEFAARDIKIDWCIVGEPSSIETLGDMVKNGRRGSLSGSLTIKGKQGHIAYPHLAANPVHLAAKAIAELCAEKWDDGNEFFDPTGFQISNIHAGTGANNITPASMEILFNFRFSTELTPEAIKERVHAILDKHKLDYSIDWHLSGVPYLVRSGELLAAVQEAINKETGIAPAVSTTGGISDGRFVAPTGAEVIEVGLVNATIHQVNERAKLSEIDALSAIYEGIIERLLG